MSRNHTYQYEPLPVPSQWGREERQFISRLTDVLDDIYLKWGRISEKELSASLRKKIDSKADGTDLQQYSTLEQTADKINAAVAEIRVGGRNLLLGTSTPLSASVSGSMGKYERANGDPLAGKTVQLHFDFTIEGGGSATLTVDMGGAILTCPLSGAKDHVRIVGELPSDDWTQAEFTLSEPTGLVTISHVQLETGTTPTQWGQADGELMAGSDVEITKDNVRISTPRFSVGYGGNDYMALDMNGGYFPRLNSPQVSPMYDGPAQLYVNHGSVDGKTYFASLTDALETVNGRTLPYDVTITVTAYEEYESVAIFGLSGLGSLIINGGGMKIYGSIDMRLCGNRLALMNVNALNSGVACIARGCQYVLLQGCAFESTAASGAVVQVNEGTHARIYKVSMIGGGNSVYVQNGSMALVKDCSGNKNMYAICSIIFASGTYPSSSTSGTYSFWEAGQVFFQNASVDMGSGSSDAPQTTATSAVLARATGYHQSVWNYGSGYLYQGVTSPYGAITGCMWFDLSGLSGKTVTAAKLRLTRVSGYGSNTAVEVRLMGLDSGCTGVNTSLSRTKDYGVIGSIPPGATRHFTLPVKAVQDLINGTTGGLCLYSRDTAVQAGLNYSANYARFYGTAGDEDTKPRLNITM